MKVCTCCKLNKLEKEFYKHSGCADGLTPRCKQCIGESSSRYAKANRGRCNESQKRWRQRHPEKCLQKSRDFRAANPEKIKIWSRAWRQANPEKILAKYIRQYGITIVQYDEMVLSQGGVCAICDGKCKSGKRLAIDHDHSTGTLRGLLCRDCNTSLGKFNDSPSRLRRAAEYLEKQ